MNHIRMIEYQGRYDLQGKAIGHGPKVAKEYYDYIKDLPDTTVSLYAPKVILEQVPSPMKEHAVELPHSICMKAGNSFKEKLLNKLGMFRNLRSAMEHSSGEVLWFFNVEYYLMLYLCFRKKKGQKIYCTLFQENFYGNGMVKNIKQWIFRKAQKKMDLIIATGPGYHYPNCKSVYIPDYVYEPQQYAPYRGKKEPLAVCLGTMSEGKQLEEMIAAFHRLDYPLVVAGRFFSEERYERLKSLAGPKIQLQNRYLTEEEYLDLLGRATFTVLPYAPEQYAKQTSGVLQEAVFLNTIPITYAKILEGNQIPGIAFSAWEELALEQLAGNLEAYYTEYENLRSKIYARGQIQEAYQRIFSES